MSEFEQNPRFENHFCHFRPWAEHYKDSPGEVGILARMLGHAWDECERQQKGWCAADKAAAAFQYAFVMNKKEIDHPGTYHPISESMMFIKALHERRENGLFTWPK